MMMISALNERADKFDEKEQKQLKMIEHVLSQAQSEIAHCFFTYAQFH